MPKVGIGVAGRMSPILPTSFEKGVGVTAQLKIQAQEFRGCVIARLIGEVDLSNAATVEGRLCGLIEQGNMVVDLSKTTFLDSTGLSAMIVAFRRGRVLGNTLRLSGAQGQVRRVLEITQLDGVLEHHDDVGDAVEAALGEYGATR